MPFCRSLPATTAMKSLCFPSPVLLPTVTAACKASNVAVGCQNIHFAEEGAYTGETSVGQLKAVGGTHTLIGHSERRQYFAETDEIVNKKLHTALKHGIIPVVCIGEVLAEREAGQTEAVLKTQVTGSIRRHHAPKPPLPSSSPMNPSGPSAPARPPRPRWPSTRTRSSAPKSPNFSAPEVAAKMRILYGGSVKPDNATALLGQEEIDGALVGGASLKPDSFTAIAKY